MTIDLHNLDLRTLRRRLWVAETQLRDVRRRYNKFHPVAMKSDWQSDQNLDSKLESEFAEASELVKQIRTAIDKKKAHR